MWARDIQDKINNPHHYTQRKVNGAAKSKRNNDTADNDTAESERRGEKQTTLRTNGTANKRHGGLQTARQTNGTANNDTAESERRGEKYTA